MLLSEAFKKELDNGRLVEGNVVLVYPRCLKILVPIDVDLSEFTLNGLLERGHPLSCKYLEVHGLKVMEGFLVKQEHLPVDMS